MSETEKSLLGNFFSGAAAGAVADFIMHPIDTVRTRLQIQRNKIESTASAERLYKNTWDAFITTVRTEGWSALYKGVGIVMVSTIPAHALYFSGYEFAKSTLRPSKSQEDKGPLVHFTAGVFADVCGSMIWVPMDVIKQRLQAQKGTSNIKYKNSLHALKTIYAEEGVRGLFKGYVAAIATYGPFVGVYFVVYEQCKKLYAKLANISPDHIPFVVQLSNGAVAGAVAATVTCPMDVIKTRLQVQSSVDKSGDVYQGISHAVQKIWREEGYRAFTKGITARILWIAPGCAITMACYEQFNKLFRTVV